MPLFSNEKITRRAMDVFLARHASQERVLDIGSGGSSYQQFFPNRITVDIDPKRKPDVVGDAYNLPFKDAEFPALLSTDVLEHLIDPAKAIAEMHRVLKPGGVLIFTTRFIYPLHDTPGDYWRFTSYGLRELFKDWDIIELTPETIDAETLAVLTQRLGFQTRMRLNAVSKALTYLLTAILPAGNKLIVKRYGDIGKKKVEDHILASGYYLVAKRKAQ